MNPSGFSGPAVGVFAAVPLWALLLMTGCNSQPASEAESVRPVKTALVTVGEGERIRTFPGVVEASRRVELAFRVPGLLAELPVKEGQMVAKGEVIARLRQDEFEARLKTLQGELDQARATLRSLQAGERPEEIQRREAVRRGAAAKLSLARIEFERHTGLFNRNVITRAEFERSETSYQVAQEEYTAALKSLTQSTVGRAEDIDAMEAQVRALSGRLVEAEIQLSDSTLKAPYAGVIAQRFVDQGQNIVPNDRVVQFQDVDEIDISVDVPETIMAAEIQLADIDRLTAVLSSAPGIEFPVRIREVAQVADPVTQTFQIRVAMQAPEGMRVLPGMTASVTMQYRRASILGDQILVPIEAIAEPSQGEQTAWVLTGENTVTPRKVQLGTATGSQVEILSGLAAGDVIVVAGVRFLRDGMKVRDLGDALGEGQL